jgi:hypothetical protein
MNSEPPRLTRLNGTPTQYQSRRTGPVDAPALSDGRNRSSVTPLRLGVKPPVRKSQPTQAEPCVRGTIESRCAGNLKGVVAVQIRLMVGP